MQASLRDFMRISIHALREEGDVSSDGQLTRPPIFLSTPSARRATTQVRGTEIRSEISIHALREEGDVCFAHMIFRLLVISIHALREEGDGFSSTPMMHLRYFYPRPPRGGRPPFLICGRRAMSHFYPRPPRGGRLLVRVKVAGVLKFLSTPSARRATSYLPGTAIVDLFLSTPSARRATPARARLQLPAQISIHALREEGDG